MKSRLLAAAVVSMAAFTTAALADQSPSMLGVWKGQSHTAMIGDAIHHFDAANQDVKFVSAEFTLVIEEEKGRNFSGYLMSKLDKERVIGAFRSNMVDGVYVDSNGSVIFERVSPDQLDVCYTHTPSPGDNSSIAACIEFKRQ